MRKKFNVDEVKELIWENEVDRIEGENRRWTRTNTSIVEFENKLYMLYWEQGLTESIENEFEEQNAPEVEKKIKTIEVREWVEKND